MWEERRKQNLNCCIRASLFLESIVAGPLQLLRRLTFTLKHDKLRCISAAAYAAIALASFSSVCASQGGRFRWLSKLDETAARFPVAIPGAIRSYSLTSEVNQLQIPRYNDQSLFHLSFLPSVLHLSQRASPVLISTSFPSSLSLSLFCCLFRREDLANRRDEGSQDERSKWQLLCARIICTYYFSKSISVSTSYSSPSILYPFLRAWSKYRLSFKQNEKRFKSKFRGFMTLDEHGLRASSNHFQVVDFLRLQFIRRSISHNSNHQIFYHLIISIEICITFCVGLG